MRTVRDERARRHAARRSTLQRHRREWEELSELDPFWAIASDREHRYGGWDRDEFFRAGERLAAQLLERADELGYPKRRRRALDFGCGVGRVTHALARSFEHVVGVDISEGMIVRAQREHASLTNCRFVVNDRRDLRQFPDTSFDLVYSKAVLQHVPTRSLVQEYLEELARVLDTGGLLALQLVTHLPIRFRIQHQRRLYRLLRTLGMPPAFLYNRLGLQPIRMTSLPEAEVASVLRACGLRVLAVDVSAERPVRLTWYYATR